MGCKPGCWACCSAPKLLAGLLHFGFGYQASLHLAGACTLACPGSFVSAPEATLRGCPDCDSQRSSSCCLSATCYPCASHCCALTACCSSSRAHQASTAVFRSDTPSTSRFKSKRLLRLSFARCVTSLVRFVSLFEFEGKASSSC